MLAVDPRAFLAMTIRAGRALLAGGGALLLAACGLVLDLDPVPVVSPVMDAGLAGDLGPPRCDDDVTCVDDGNPCNGLERCLPDGTCDRPVPACNDGIECTSDVCEPGVGCVHVPNDNLCVGADRECLSRICSPDLGCVTGPPDSRLCEDDGIDCTISFCSAVGRCFDFPADGRCDGDLICDPNFGCADEIRCQGDGVCPERPCAEAVTCVGGACVYRFAELGTLCDTGDPCEVGRCAVDGECRVLRAVECGADDDPCTAAVCVPDGTGDIACAQELPEDPLPCNDLDPCTGPDRCDASGVCVGVDLCVAPDACSTSTCEPGIGCSVRTRCGANSACAPDGRCECLAGFADCNGDGNCRCDLGTRSCVGTRCR